MPGPYDYLKEPMRLQDMEALGIKTRMNPYGISDINDLFVRSDFKPYTPSSVQFTTDPLLSIDSILAESKKPLDATSIIAPQLPLLQEDALLMGGQLKADAISEIGTRRGLAGGSTLAGTVFKDIPGQVNKAYADAQTKLLLEALPIAQAEKQANVQNAISLRSMVGDEQFKKLGLEQQERLAASDQSLKIELSNIDREFNARITIAQQKFEASQNEIDRQIAAKQYQELLSERKKAREGAFLSGLTSLVGMGIGAGMATNPLLGAFVGSQVGKMSGDTLGFLF